MKRMRHGLCEVCGRGIHQTTLGTVGWWFHDVPCAGNAHAAVLKERTEPAA